jgi:hypothetical protein
MEFELGGAFVETLQARINAVFPVWLNSLGSNSGVPFLPESATVRQSYFCFCFNSGFGKPGLIGLKH